MPPPPPDSTSRSRFLATRSSFSSPCHCTLKVACIITRPRGPHDWLPSWCRRRDCADWRRWPRFSSSRPRYKSDVVRTNSIDTGPAPGRGRDGRERNHRCADRSASRSDTAQAAAAGRVSAAGAACRIRDLPAQSPRHVVARGIDRPWSLLILPDGDMLVSQRYTNEIRVIRKGVLDPKPLGGLPAMRRMLDIVTIQNTPKTSGSISTTRRRSVRASRRWPLREPATMAVPR